MRQKLSAGIDPYTLKSTKAKALWALADLEDLDRDRVTSYRLAKHLVEKCGINISRQAVDSTLKNARNAVHKNKKGYKLMEEGKDELRALTQAGGVTIIEAGKPYTSKRHVLKSILSKMSGFLYVTDPYLDIDTLDAVFGGTEKGLSVRVITSKVAEKTQGEVARYLKDLWLEGYSVEIRKYKSSELHDRYLIDKNAIWISGNSLNHLGSKESFIIKLGDDIRQTMLEVFNRRWRSAQKI